MLGSCPTPGPPRGQASRGPGPRLQRQGEGGREGAAEGGTKALEGRERARGAARGGALRRRGQEHPVIPRGGAMSVRGLRGAGLWGWSQGEPGGLRAGP